MPTRICPNCNKSFYQKQHYEYHINPNRKNACLRNNPQKDLISNEKTCNQPIRVIQNNPNKSKIIQNNQNNQNTKSITADENICNYCEKVFTTKSNLNKHILNACKIKKLESEKIHNQLKIKDIEIQLIKEKLELSEKHCKTLEKENEYHKQLVNATGNLIQNSMSSLNYLITNFKEAPILKSLEDYSSFDKNTKLIENIIYFHKKNKLYQYLGDFLIMKYKTEDPNKRQTWNTDISRLTYINRSLVNESPSWVVDKKGLSVIKVIINPFLQYIKVESQKTIIELEKIMENTSSNIERQNILIKMQILNEIIYKINIKVLEEDINKYLAAHLYLDKNKYMIS